MTPTPQNRVPHDATLPQKNGNRIVISGMSGLYPQSSNVKELSDILYNKVDPITKKDYRCNYYHPEVKEHTGSIPGLDYFDAKFFKVSYHLASTMDAMSRKILEAVYEAIYDAGMNPGQLSGQKVAVYIGACFSETEKTNFYDITFNSSLSIAGCNRSMFANRISYWLNTKGPSLAIDEACCSSTAAMEQGYLAMTRGECTAAIVSGCYLCLHPQSSIHCGRAIKLCADGKTRSFDERADGCVKSEGINVLFLQKAKDALRIYAEVLNVQTEFRGTLKSETGQKYGFQRDLGNTTNFLQTFYKDAGVSPQDIEYVEAYGSAEPEAEKTELQAIEEVFCKNRSDPLFIGSVMSNIGYQEAATGISGIIKVLLGFHNGQLAANLHCSHPRKDIAALRDGRMLILTEHQQFGRTYGAVNGLSITGMNSHVLLHGNYKPKHINRYTASLPYLVTISGRHEDAVKHVFEILKSNPIDPEQVALLHNIHRMAVPGHLSRGFIILQTDKEQKVVSLSEKSDYFDDVRRPLWFVYSGMGSQWAGMGVHLMRIPIFAAAIERCRKVLEPKGIDIVNIITSDDKGIFDNIINSFVGIAAIQIGLTDILHELGFKPDGIIGHSAGELGCAYADGCLTAEEIILSAYYRGMVSVETKFIHGSMAAVGLGYKEVSKMCPPEIEIACHNGPQSSTISGPSNVMREFVAKLTASGIFAKEVPCSNIAYHSRYIADAGPELLKYLQDLIITPKERSERWLSTSVPKDMWIEPTAKLCSAEYLTNNLLNPVLFDETSRLIPNNAVLVEIAPHGLLQAILKRSMPDKCTNIALTRREHPDTTVILLEAIGKLYMEGYNSNIRVLYPKIEFPVSTGTPFLSHFVKWAHEEKWQYPLYCSGVKGTAATASFILALEDKEHTYLKGHSIRGSILYPFTASLTLVWDVLAMTLNVTKKQLSVEFIDIQLYSQPMLIDRQQLKLRVSILRGTGYFEVFDDTSKVATGFIKPIQNNDLLHVLDDCNKNTCIIAEDVYQMLRDRDYCYSGDFQSIASVDESLCNAELLWHDNWITFIDGMLQLNALRQPHYAVSQPANIRRIIIDVEAHNIAILKSNTSDNKISMQAQVSELNDYTRCGGVIVETIRFHQLPPYRGHEIALKYLNFVNYFNSGIDVFSSLEVYFQMVANNLNKNTITVVGVRNQAEESSMFMKIDDVLKNIFGIKVNYTQITQEQIMNNYKFEDIDMMFIANLFSNKNVCQQLKEVLPRDTFVVSEEYVELSDPSEARSLYRVLSVHINNEKTKLQLVRWGPLTDTNTVANCEEGKCGGEYYLTDKQINTRSQNVTLQGAQYGDYDLFKWIKLSALTDSGITVNVCYAGINNNDVKLANSSLLFRQNVPNTYGMDFSGVTESGKRVMGIVRSGAASTQVRAQPELLWPVPAHWTLEDAATVPLAYAQAFYCLGIKVRLPRGKSVFVHGGAGALGQAVISIALALDCEVFTTVRDTHKKHFLQKLFPALKANHIGCSRDHTFGDMFKFTSEGNKCDVVISCVGGMLKDMTFTCINYFGLFLDISQIQNEDLYNFGMAHLNNEKTYITVKFSSIFEVENTEDLKTIHKMVSEGITRGYVRPLSRVTYAPHEAPRAFRLLAASAHRGRVLLRMKENNVQAHCRMTCRADCANLILCGNTMFSLQFADRLVTRGAKILYLHVWTQSSYLKHKIRSWQRLGIKVLVSSESLNNQKAVLSLLNNCLMLGPMEGVYVVAEETATDSSLTSMLDAEIRRLSIDLSHFAVFNFGDNLNGKSVCLNRLCDKLPATVLMLPEIKEETYNTFINWRNALDAAELAIENNHGVALAHEISYKPSPLLQVARIAGLNIPEDVAKSLTLQELGIQRHKLQMLSTFLRVQYNQAFDEEQILELTINTILQIERKPLPLADIKGLSTFFSYIDSDELLATTDFVLLSTLAKSVTLEDQYFESNQINLCIVPGMEGHYRRFGILCERLKLPALVLQPGLDHPHETVSQTAQRLSEVLLKKTAQKDGFYLVGYESGILVALEMAAILEDHGLSGTVFCIGCTPEELQLVIEEQLLPFENEKQLQDEVLMHMYSLMAGGDSIGLHRELQGLSTWSQKIDACVGKLLGLVSHSAQYARSHIECALARISQIRQRDIALRPLRSQVILLRAAIGHAPLQHTALQNVSQHPLIVYQLDSPLAHIATDLRCTAIINEHLGSAVLDNFSAKNICDTYLLSDDSFVSELLINK